MPYANIEEQRKAQREYYYRNKEAVNKKTKEWKEANPKRNAEFKVTWRKNNSEKAKEQNRTSAERFRKNNLERCRKYNRQYKIDNPDVIQSAKAIRRAKKWGTYKLLSKEEKAMCRSFYTEAKERNQEEKTKYVVDHIIPISKGGGHTPNNLQVVPDVWNSHKGNKLWGKYKGRL